MLPIELILACYLLTQPPNFVDNPECIAIYQSLLVRSSIQSVAIQIELLDPRESGYILNNDINLDFFCSSLKMLRTRNRDLANAPFLNDCFRFPDQATTNELLGFNRIYREKINNQIGLNHLQIIVETDHLYHILELVREAGCECYNVNLRRQSLQSLRDMMGCEAYYSGNLPPCVPLWRFVQR